MIDLIPIGSIAELKDNKKTMIIGYNPSLPNDTEQYDYIVCSPNGLNKEKEKLIYNEDYFYIKKEDIINIFYIGFSDRNFDLFEEIHNEILNKIKQKKDKMDNNELNNILNEVIEKHKKGNSQND